MTQKPRYLALDVLRGMTVCLMIVVNTPGTGASPFAPLEHAPWHGFTPTDLVFPSFLFAVGNAMAFAMGKYSGMPAGQVVARILKRSLIIFLLGFLMYWFPFVHQTQEGLAWNPFSDTRIFGVLQRIGICYGTAALMIHFLSKRAVWTISAIFLLGYWLVMYLMGDYTLLGNFQRILDLKLLGGAHMYDGEGVAFDPEGVLSTFPAVVNVIIGYYAGVFVRDKGNNYETIARIALAGAAMMALAYFWDLVFPINKKLWTSSYVLYTCGLDLLILGALIYIIEILGLRKWTYFFEVFGKNPLFIYLLSEIIAILFWFFMVGGKTVYEAINVAVFQKLMPGPFGSLAFALSVMFFCWLVGWMLDKRRIYVRV